MIYQNRRGQIAILMLVIVAIVLVISTLFAFFSSESASPKSSGFSELLIAGESNVASVTDMAKLIVKESVTSGRSFSAVADGKYGDLSAAQVAPYGNFFQADFTIENIGEKDDELYNLKINRLFIEARFGNNYEKKNFDLCMLFDKDGDYLREKYYKNDYRNYC